HLRQVVGLRGYAQRDPLNEYKTEAFTLFEALLNRLREAVTAQLMRIEMMQQPELEDPELDAYEQTHIDPSTGRNEIAGDGQTPPQQAISGKVPRNAPCPCGSGKKFKHCHGRVV
ncbi:MAG: SEC-C metal-binding domain-containing protein, partial [Hyphomicrobiales bacterium]